MQYQSTLDREGLIDLAIHKYFGNVDKKELASVLDCFHDNAMITVQTAFTVHDGKDNIERMFVDFMGAWKTIVHKDFTCTVDEKNGRITANFLAELEDEISHMDPSEQRQKREQHHAMERIFSL